SPSTQTGCRRGFEGEPILPPWGKSTVCKAVEGPPPDAALIPGFHAFIFSSPFTPRTSSAPFPAGKEQSRCPSGGKNLGADNVVRIALFAERRARRTPMVFRGDSRCNWLSRSRWLAFSP